MITYYIFFKNIFLKNQKESDLIKYQWKTMFLDLPKSYMQITKRTFETIQSVADIFFQPAKIASSGFWNEWTRAEDLRRKSKNSIYIEYLTIVFRCLRPRLIAVHHCSICVEPIILHRDTRIEIYARAGRVKTTTKTSTLRNVHGSDE